MMHFPIGTGEHPLQAMVFESPGALGEHLARTILEDIAAARLAGRGYVLGCPNGRTPMSTYEALGRLAAADQVDCSHVTLAMMDEYLTRTEHGFEYCPADAHYGCHRAAYHDIAGVIGRGLPDACRIRPAQVWFPDPARPDAYDRRLQDAGGIDLFIIASGASDGHVAFNAPGSAIDSVSRVVQLPETTRRDNLRTFPRFQGLAEVPLYGVSIGLRTICTLARRTVLVMHGADKRNAVKRLAACRDFDTTWPASCIFRCRNPKILLDQEALP